MQRYFAKIAYKGTDFSGWQIQPNAPTVQQNLEFALNRLYGVKIPIVGCGRTDAGVHASEYFMHFDILDKRYSREELIYKLNALTSEDIAVYNLIKVDKKAHARFDATSRSYVYKIHFNKNPFLKDLSYKYDQSKPPNFEKVDAASKLILNYKDFYTFCKSNTEVETFKCEIFNSEWILADNNNWEYHVTANRFLRGMVRLLVGMCLNVGIDKILLSDVQHSLDMQKRLSHAWSVPAEGLYLSNVKYPFIEFN